MHQTIHHPSNPRQTLSKPKQEIRFERGEKGKTLPGNDLVPKPEFSALLKFERRFSISNFS